jgi:hypothetical protein
MASSTTPSDLSDDTYDLLILIDATYSMSTYLTSLTTSLPKIISISALTHSFSRIGLLAYRDYCSPSDELLEWSGWKTPSQLTSSAEKAEFMNFVTSLKADGGGDIPEATKTGLARGYELMREEATTIVLLYTDAPPHTISNKQKGWGARSNHDLEQDALSAPGAFGGMGHHFVDWVAASKFLGKTGKKKASVFCILQAWMPRFSGDYYTFLSTVTEGSCFYLTGSESRDISEATVGLLLAWMGAEKAGGGEVKIGLKMARFKRMDRVEKAKKEAGKGGNSDVSHVDELEVDAEVLRKYMPRRKTPVQDFAQRYKVDGEFRKLVTVHMRQIIEDDVTAISLNPVFGSLWRAVCNDRDNEERGNLTESFSKSIEGIRDAEEKERMKAWLEESYDFGADVKLAIEDVREEDQFPCVYLDPTLSFTVTSGNGEDADDNRPVNEFRRAELLEIGRSCDPRILRRLGRILTRLTVINTPEELPAHIRSAEESKIQRIPLALASSDYDRKFWKILLHIIVPGTMLSARPAALLAALTIHMGVKPLLEAADKEMLAWKDFWTNIEVPETWNVSCLSLLLDADAAFRIRKSIGDKVTNVQALLKESDRKLFELLVSYKMLEFNLDTTLTAKVSWCPEKTIVPIGPLVTCKSCHFPRSVTIMGPKSRCGNCLGTVDETPEKRAKCIQSRVSKDNTEQTDAIWVECAVRRCRSQYVLYNPEDLNVRPKCHYCRFQASLAKEKGKAHAAPWVECRSCLSRIIYPQEYRIGSFSHFKCPACTSGRHTVVDVQTTARKLRDQNGITWLLQNDNAKLSEPLGGGSLFKQISAAGISGFCDQVSLFPTAEKPDLTLEEKPVQNAQQVVADLKLWVFGRRAAEQGCCSLCFTDLRKQDLHPACGRRGCEQKVCRECLVAWYGLNASGRIINVAALSCPFCRRAPTAKTLHNYGMGVHAVADLRSAVERAGNWIYAWCIDCATAKPYLERVCAAGAPAELQGFICDACEQIREENAVLEAQERVDWIVQMERDGRRMAYEERQAYQLEIEKARVKKYAKLFLKHCPGCKALTEKSGGCGHMECRCGQHWCWFCGEASNSHDIYRHMDEVHGNWFEPEIEVIPGQVCAGCETDVAVCVCGYRYGMMRGEIG